MQKQKSAWGCGSFVGLAIIIIIALAVYGSISETGGSSTSSGSDLHLLPTPTSQPIRYVDQQPTLGPGSGTHYTCDYYNVGGKGTLYATVRQIVRNGIVVDSKITYADHQTC